MPALVLSARTCAACWLASSLLALALAQPSQAPEPPTAAWLVEANAVAKGGQQAWQKINSMVWTGYVQTAHAPERKLPFLLEQQRPASSRFELVAEGQKSVRVFAATDGWKLRGGGAGRPEVQGYSADELKFARGTQVIDGPLMDFATRGSHISLIGRDVLEGQQAYVLEVKTAEGETHHVWLDAESFLELRLDRGFHNSAGKSLLSTVLYRDYRAFEGLQIPVLVETSAGNEKSFSRLVIERVALNPALDAQRFVKPVLPVARRSGAAVVDTRAAALSAQPIAARPVNPP